MSEPEDPDDLVEQQFLTAARELGAAEMTAMLVEAGVLLERAG